MFTFTHLCYCARLHNVSAYYGIHSCISNMWKFVEPNLSRAWEAVDTQDLPL
jgi:hypothetical protein